MGIVVIIVSHANIAHVLMGHTLNNVIYYC